MVDHSLFRRMTVVRLLHQAPEYAHPPSKRSPSLPGALTDLTSPDHPIYLAFHSPLAHVCHRSIRNVAYRAYRGQPSIEGPVKMNWPCVGGNTTLSNVANRLSRSHSSSNSDVPVRLRPLRYLLACDVQSAPNWNRYRRTWQQALAGESSYRS